MKGALSSSETSVLTRATRRNIPEDAILHLRLTLVSGIPKTFLTTAFVVSFLISSVASDYCDLPFEVPLHLLLLFCKETNS
jgi:hypothetical protein